MSSKQRKKVHRGRIKGYNYQCNKLAFGDFGLKVQEPFILTEKQKEACRRLIRRGTSRSGEVWSRCSTDTPYTKKPVGTRMGGGASAVEYYGTKVKPGTIIFEMYGVDEKTAREIFSKVAYKLPIKKFKFVKNNFE
ncbi:50S ribosomal protein L16 [Lyticum sinuosum]|uniref:50S ribosomal protein L16 n=1 Tax=Lyticum sinuosum TaxID=1332059 RepID=A0AAE4VKP8_9RICK|nr:50S ribosomal protein L16 [Lyticum sinuosum]MDZ5761183.1 50S ribosomal protein L16 [Lyticum sinuosum]